MPKPEQTLSFDDVYTNYYEATLRRVYRFTKDPTTARDLCQDIFLKMWRNWSTFDRNKGSLFTWIMIITTSTCIDHVRSNTSGRRLPRRYGEICEASRPLGPDGFLARHEVHRLTNRLPSWQRDVLNYIYFKGLTQDETARILKLPLGTVKSRQRSAILALRKMYL